MQKYTEEERSDFDNKRTAAELETRTKYKPEIDRETARLEAEIESAKQIRDAKKRKGFQDELRHCIRQMEDRIRTEARALLKERFSYSVFLYEAEKVGITSTGEEDQNELYPNPRQTPDNEGKTCLELYRAFLKEPERFLREGA